MTYDEIAKAAVAVKGMSAPPDEKCLKILLSNAGLLKEFKQAKRNDEDKVKKILDLMGAKDSLINKIIVRIHRRKRIIFWLSVAPVVAFVLFGIAFLNNFSHLIAIGLLLAIIVLAIIAYDRFLHEQQKRNTELILDDIADFIIHCQYNLGVLRTMEENQKERTMEKSQKEIPRSFHFQKMKPLWTAFNFNDHDNIALQTSYARVIHRLKLEFRNLDMDIDTLLTYIKREDCSVGQVYKFVDLLIEKMMYMTNELPNYLQKFKDSPRHLDRCSAVEQKGQDPRPIIYYDLKEN